MNKKDVERLEGEVRGLRRKLDEAESRMEGLEARARKAEHTVAEYEEAVADVNLTVDAVMAETAMTYGTPVLHDDGSLKGYHLQLGKFDPPGGHAPVDGDGQPERGRRDAHRGTGAGT
nr:MAG TPA: General control protein GCN4 and CLUSTER, BENDABLE REGION, CONTRACTILE.6A [Caudoviricetes sp.]